MNNMQKTMNIYKNMQKKDIALQNLLVEWVILDIIKK